MRIFPEMCASTLWPFSSSTRNMALGRGSMTVPSRTIASSLGFGGVVLLRSPTGAAAGRDERSIRQRADRPWYLLPRPTPKGLVGAPRSPWRACHSWERQHLGSVIGDGDGVLEVGRELPVGGDDRPAVVEQAGGGAADVDHRLD